MKFRDYYSGYEEFRSKARQIMLDNNLSKEIVDRMLGFDTDDFGQYYNSELNKMKSINAVMAGSRFLSELLWYKHKRPFFNVYPLIERKFMEMNDSIDLLELRMPLPSIEVRTANKTMLLSDFGNLFMLTIELGKKGEYQEFRISKQQTLSAILTNDYVKQSENLFPKSSTPDLSVAEVQKAMFLAAGVCLLAKDSSIITPVILNKHRRKDMTAAEMEKYAAKAVNRTGRIGFEIGREIERMKATIHYRNGCFAKYYVGKNHESYPADSVESRVPIIKWRCGSIVNQNSIPKVPTGYKD